MRLLFSESDRSTAIPSGIRPSFLRPSDSLRVLTPDEINPTALTLLWQKRATKLEGVPRPFIYCLWWLNAEWKFYG